MKGLQTYIRKLFLPDLLPGVDDCHQLQRCFVHATRHDYVLHQQCFVGLANQQNIAGRSMIRMLRGVIKAFRKSDLLSMRLVALTDSEAQSVKTIVCEQVVSRGRHGGL
jgi:hypothetical protein